MCVLVCVFVLIFVLDAVDLLVDGEVFDCRICRLAAVLSGRLLHGMVCWSCLGEMRVCVCMCVCACACVYVRVCMCVFVLCVYIHFA